ncbi:MAG: hypothetical protein AAGB24_03195 [Bacteroidota bacterium]
MSFDKYTTAQLRKKSKILLIIGSMALIAMIIVLALALYDIAEGESSSLIYLVPTVIGPLAIIPAVLASIIAAEIKRREKNKS